MELGLEGTVAVVTGGSDGIGKATAARLLAEGAKVAICGRDQDRLDAAASDLAGGDDLLAVRADVSDPDQLRAFIAEVAEHFGRLDVLVNNAGVSAAKAFDRVDDDLWHADLDLKLHAAIVATRAALPFLRSSGRGRVINVTAIGGKHPGAGSLPTSVSRAAGIALTKAMSKDLAGDGILVNAVCIGLVKSGQHERSGAERGLTAEQTWAELGQQVPLGRPGEADEAANVIAFLASTAASYVSGTAVNIDGGLSSAT